MSDSTFELNKPSFYKTKTIEENDFLDNDQYGNTWYNVIFHGNAETILWLAKEKPEEDKEYYGIVEKTKSGKALRFKRQQVPEDLQKPIHSSSNAYTGSRDDKAYQDGQAWGNALTNAVVTVQTWSVVKSYSSLQAMREDIVVTAQYYFNARNEKSVIETSTGEPPLTDDDIPADFR